MNLRDLMELVDAAYDTGYYAGEGESGSDVHKDRIKDREALRVKLINRLTAADALATAVARAKACAHYLTPEILDALRKYREAEGR